MYWVDLQFSSSQNPSENPKQQNGMLLKHTSHQFVAQLQFTEPVSKTTKEVWYHLRQEGKGKSLRILTISSWTTAVEITSLHTNTLASIIRLLAVSPSTWRRQTESLQRKSSFIRIVLSSCNFPFHICSIKSTSAFRHFFETRLFDGYFLAKNACSQLPFHWRVGFIQGSFKVCQCYFTKPFDLDHIIIQGVIISSFLSFTCG